LELYDPIIDDIVNELEMDPDEKMWADVHSDLVKWGEMGTEISNEVEETVPEGG
jgi:hypothetical protein